MRLSVLFFLAYLVYSGSALGQVGNPDTPIVFENGNTIDVSALFSATTLSSFPLVVSSQIQVNGTGGTLTDTSQSSVSFLTPFTGTGTLTVDVGANSFAIIGGNIAFVPPQTLPCGFVLEFGSNYFRPGSTTIAGPFSVTGDSSLQGNITFTSNTISGSGAATLTLDDNAAGHFHLLRVGLYLRFRHRSPATEFQSMQTVLLVLNNTSGTQTFTGAIGDYVYRVGEGGTTVFTGAVEENLLVEGGTAVLSGAGRSCRQPRQFELGDNASRGALVFGQYPGR